MEHNQNLLTKSKQINQAFVIGIVLNLAYVLIQVLVGIRISSLSLLSDAGHNFLDVSGLALSLLAFKLTKTKANNKYTYGYKKSSILISLLNTIILLISIGAIGYEATTRFQNPEPLPGKVIAIIALIGIFINGISAYLFFRDKDKDINIKSAFLHLFSDTLISLGLVVGGIVIYYSHLYWIDPLLSIVICCVIIVSTWNLLRSSIHLSMDGVPENIDLEMIRKVALDIEGINEVHHIHVWAISTTENALTGHFVVSKNLTAEQINSLKHEVKSELKRLHIEHCTLEIETENDQCDDEDC